MTASFSEYCTYYVRINIFHGNAGDYRLLLSEAIMQLTRNHVTTWFICEWLLCKAFYNMLLLLNVTKNSVVIGYHVFLLKVLCQKRKPQIDGFVLRILHILDQEKYLSWRCRVLQTTAVRGFHAVNKKPCYCMVRL